MEQMEQVIESIMQRKKEEREAALSPPPKPRFAGIDIVKILACFFVTAVHFFRNSGFYNMPITKDCGTFAIYIRWLTFTCVPLFMITTGFLMKNKKLSGRYYLGIIRVLVLYIVISLIAFIQNDDTRLVCHDLIYHRVPAGLRDARVAQLHNGVHKTKAVLHHAGGLGAAGFHAGGSFLLRLVHQLVRLVVRLFHHAVGLVAGLGHQILGLVVRLGQNLRPLLLRLIPDGFLFLHNFGGFAHGVRQIIVQIIQLRLHDPPVHHAGFRVQE